MERTVPTLNANAAVMIRAFEPAALSPYRAGRHELLGQITVASIICGGIFLPAIVLNPDLPWFKAEVVALPFILFIYAWLLLAGRATVVRFNPLFLVGALYTISVAFSIWYGALLLGQTVIFRDFYEFPKLWLPVVFFTIAYHARLSERALRRLLDFFAAALVLVCLYAWAQWADLRFTHWLNQFYEAGEHAEAGLQYARRVFSTMGNPNCLAELLTWCIAAFILATWLRVGNQLRNVLMTFALLITLGMTGSRYGLLDTSLALVLLIAVSFASGTRRFSRLLPLLALLPLFASAVYFVSSSNSRTLARFQTLSNPWITDSYRQRADDTWRDASDAFYQSPFLGRGPARTMFEGIITDSEYLDVLKKFGLIGFLIYLGYYFVPLWMLRPGLRAGKRAGPALEQRLPATFLTMRLSFVMILTALVMNIGMSSFYNQVLVDFLWMWMGLGAAAARSIADSSKIYLFPVPSEAP